MQNYKTILKHPKIMGWDFLAFMPIRQQNGCTIRKNKKPKATMPTAYNLTVAELDVIAPICNSYLNAKIRTYFNKSK